MAFYQCCLKEKDAEQVKLEGAKRLQLCFSLNQDHKCFGGICADAKDIAISLMIRRDELIIMDFLSPLGCVCFLTK